MPTCLRASVRLHIRTRPQWLGDKRREAAAAGMIAVLGGMAPAACGPQLRLRPVSTQTWLPPPAPRAMFCAEHPTCFTGAFGGPHLDSRLVRSPLGVVCQDSAEREVSWASCPHCSSSAHQARQNSSAKRIDDCTCVVVLCVLVSSGLLPQTLEFHTGCASRTKNGTATTCS